MHAPTVVVLEFVVCHDLTQDARTCQIQSCRVLQFFYTQYGARDRSASLRVGRESSFLRVHIPTRAEPDGAQHRCRTLLNVKSKLSHLTVDTEIHHAPHSQYRRFRPLDDSKEMRFARLTAMLRTSIAFASRSHSAHTSRNPTTSCNSKRLVWSAVSLLPFLQMTVENMTQHVASAAVRTRERAFGITCSATGTSEVKLRRGWPLRGQQMSRIKWRLLRTSLGINSTLHRGGRSLVSRSLYDTSLHPSRLSSVALLLHSMSDETNTSGRKSCQSPHADESTTLLKTKNTLRFATTTPWFVGSWYVWSEQWCPFFLCPLWPVYRGKEICDPCVGFLSWLHRAVSTRQELCLNDLHNTRKWKRKNEKRKANSICESEKRKGHGKGYNFMIHMTWETRVQEDGCAYEHQKRPRAKALRDTFGSSGVGALVAPRWWTLQEQLSITQEREFLSKKSAACCPSVCSTRASTCHTVRCKTRSWRFPRGVSLTSSTDTTSDVRTILTSTVSSRKLANRSVHDLLPRAILNKSMWRDLHTFHHFILLKLTRIGHVHGLISHAI